MYARFFSYIVCTAKRITKLFCATLTGVCFSHVKVKYILCTKHQSQTGTLIYLKMLLRPETKTIGFDGSVRAWTLQKDSHKYKDIVLLTQETLKNTLKLNFFIQIYIYKVPVFSLNVQITVIVNHWYFRFSYPKFEKRANSYKTINCIILIIKYCSMYSNIEILSGIEASVTDKVRTLFRIAVSVLVPFWISLGSIWKRQPWKKSAD